MQEEAEKHKDEDEKKAETIKLKIAPTQLLQQLKSSKRRGDKIDTKVKEQVEEKVKALKEVAQKDSTKEEIETATKIVRRPFKVGEAMYKDQPKADGQQTTAEEPKEGDKDDKKKKLKKVKWLSNAKC